MPGKRGAKAACELVVKLVDAQQGTGYLRLAAANLRLEDFMAGWVGTRLGNLDLSTCGRPMR